MSASVSGSRWWANLQKVHKAALKWIATADHVSVIPTDKDGVFAICFKQELESMLDAKLNSRHYLEVNSWDFSASSSDILGKFRRLCNFTNQSDW